MYKIVSHFFLCLLLSTIAVNCINAQRINYSGIMHDLGLIQKAFKTDFENAFLSCNIKYLYSMESAPQKYLDSLAGLYKANGHSRYTKISKTETVENDSVVLVVYNDDKTIIASSPIYSKNTQSLMLSNIDSVFVAANLDSVDIKQKQGQKIMSFHFTHQSAYYSCKIFYDATTYVPHKITYILKSSKVPEAGKPQRDGAVITIEFSGYNSTSFDRSVVDAEKYISILPEGKAVIKPAYNDYKLLQRGVLKKVAH